MLIEVSLEFVHHVRVIILPDVALDHCCLLLSSLLSSLARVVRVIVINIHRIFVLFVVKLIVFSFCGLLRLHIHKEPYNDS